MPLQPGTRLGPYEIIAALGSGGMGEVYRARDARLNRDVAIKVLPHEFTLDADRLARFKREAQVLAALNHPNIAAIYGVEDSPQALVLELVEGDTLASRVARGALPIDEALSIAAQIAEALEAAHEQGIIHRDLKPANVKLRPDGRVKVLDFGLAKLTGAPDNPRGSSSGSSRGIESPTFSPTMTSPDMMTGFGIILGTAAYMSPEQARGRPTDKRSDVWAFGCLLYEMLTGARPFTGDDVSSTHAAILEREPSWDRLPKSTPPLVRRLLRRCLEKDPRRRLHDIADARLEIEDARNPSAADVPGTPAPSSPRLAAWSAAIVLAAVAAGVLAWVIKPMGERSGVSSNAARFLIAPPEPLNETEGVLVMSRDGRRIAFAAGAPGRQRLFVRDLDQFDSRPIPGTEGVVSATFSPDGQSIAFLAERRLKTVALAGGTPLTLRDRVDGAGLNWTDDQTILFNPGTATGIWRIPVTGGEPTALTVTGGKDNFHRFPELLPNGKAVLFSSQGGVADDQIYVESLATHQRMRLLFGSAPHYLASGYLVYVQTGTLYAIRFDSERLQLNGSPVPLLQGIRQARSSAPLISYSEVGTIAYVPTSVDSGSNTMVWVDRTGAEEPTGAPGRLYAQPRLSPDGRRVVTSMRGNAEDLWVWDLVRGAASRLTTDSSSSFPAWTPDGRRLTLTSARDAAYNMYSRALDGSAPDERLQSSDRPQYPFSWSPDGKMLVFVSVSPTTFQDLWVFTTEDKKARPFLETPFREGAPVFSPDGRWIAYVSDDSGRFEIYARPYPGPGEKWPISTEGGSEPMWPRDGRELFYRAGDAMMAVEIATSPTFSVGKPRRLFEKPYERSVALWANYDVSADGRRLLMVRRQEPASAATHINVVLNWQEELKTKLPAQ